MLNFSAKFLRKFIILAVLVILLGIVLFQLNVSPKNSHTATSSNSRVIAITQIAPHPSLDEIRRGIMDSLDPKILAKKKIPPVEIVSQNAQGNVTTATQIAAKFVSLKPLVIVPITTPSAQSVYNLTKNKDIPIVFAAISDPATAKLLPTAESPYITGVSDAAPIQAQVQLMKDCLEGSRELKTVGVIFNPGEANSVKMIEIMTEELAKHHIKVIQATANTTTEIAAAVQSLVGRVSAIYFPNDNTVASALEAVLKITREHKIPVFSSDPESVQRGCLAAIAPDQYEVGQQVGQLIIKVLKGTSIKNLPIEQARKNIMVINIVVAQELGISLKNELLQKADRLIKPLS
jgi:putative ABC transport system substrate-binding protein